MNAVIYCCCAPLNSHHGHHGDLIQLKEIKVEAADNPGFSFNIPDEAIKFISEHSPLKLYC